MPAIYKRPGSRTWWTRFKVNGRRIRCSTGEADEPRARTKAAAIESEARRNARQRGPAPIGGGPLIVELATADIESARARGVSAGTIETNTVHWRAIRWAEAFGGGHGRAGIVSHASLKAYAIERREAGARGQTIRRELSMLRRALIDARNRGEIVNIPDPWPKIRSDAPHPTRRGREIPPHLVAKFLAELPDDGLRDTYAFALLTGLRAEEIHRLCLSWVEATPPGSPVPAMVRAPAYGTKTRREREVGLLPEALEILRRRPQDDLDSPVFPAFDRRATVRAAAKRAGIAFVPTLRDCRTTHASVAAYSTGDAKAVQAALGHSNLKTTDGYMRSTLSRTLSVPVAVAAALGVGGATGEGGTGSGTKSDAADSSAASGAWDWTRTSTVLPTNPSTERARGVSCSCCARRCALLQHLPSEPEGEGAQEGAQRKRAVA